MGTHGSKISDAKMLQVDYQDMYSKEELVNSDTDSESDLDDFM